MGDDYTPESYYSLERDPYNVNRDPGPRESPFPAPASRMRTVLSAIKPGATTLDPGAFVDLPGPAAGLVRLYEPLIINTQGLVAGAAPVTARLNPGNWLLNSSNPPVSGGLLYRIPALFAGESYRVTNTAAVAVGLSFGWVDVPATGLTAVRLAVTAALQTAIPAPAAGFARRWAQWASTAGGTRVITPLYQAINADSVTHNLEMLQGVAVVFRANQIAGSGFQSNINAGVHVTADVGALQARCAEAMGTGFANLIGAYETIAAAA